MGNEAQLGNFGFRLQFHSDDRGKGHHGVFATSVVDASPQGKAVLQAMLGFSYAQGPAPDVFEVYPGSLGIATRESLLSLETGLRWGYRFHPLFALTNESYFGASRVSLEYTKLSNSLTLYRNGEESEEYFRPMIRSLAVLTAVLPSKNATLDAGLGFEYLKNKYSVQHYGVTFRLGLGVFF